MNRIAPRLFLMFLCGLTTACGRPTAKVPVPTAKPSLLFSDADLDTITVGVKSPTKPRVERGLVSILVYHGNRRIGSALRWTKTGEPATASLRLSKSELVAWARAIDNLELPGVPALTYSVAIPSKHGPKPKGIPNAEYFAARADAGGLDFRTTTRVDGWNRSRWLFVPWEKCSTELFVRLERTCRNDKLKRLVHLLGIHYEANKQ